MLSIESSIFVPVPCVNGGFKDAASTFVKMSAVASPNEAVAESCEWNNKNNFVN